MRENESAIPAGIGRKNSAGFGLSGQVEYEKGRRYHEKEETDCSNKSKWRYRTKIFRENFSEILTEM